MTPSPSNKAKGTAASKKFAEKTSSATTTFSNGDRVEYTGKRTPGLTPGDRGVINDDDVATAQWIFVKWNDGHGEDARRGDLKKL